MARLLSVNVGLPRDIEWQGKTVHTAVWKAPAKRRRMARRLNIDCDGQGDLAGHRGEHRAVFVYQIESYSYWQKPTRPKQLYLRPIRREFYRRRSAGCRSAHRRSLPDRRCPVRSDAAARHLLSGGHPHERAYNSALISATVIRSGPALTFTISSPAPTFAFHEDAKWKPGRPCETSNAAGSPGQRAGTRAADPGLERRLENLARSTARPGTERRRSNEATAEMTLGVFAQRLLGSLID